MKIKKIFNKETLLLVLSILIIAHPVIELDYLAYDCLSSIGLPRLTTIVGFVILPILVLITFVVFEKNKKRSLILFGIYSVVFCIYFYLHCKNADYLQYNMRLTSNFVFLLKDEVFYSITLLLPLLYIYVFNKNEIKDSVLEKITIGLSLVTSTPIFISNIFVFGESTYQGYTIDGFLSWFSLPYNNLSLHPRKYATKFFFEEGNTIGILLIMVLPFLYYFFYKNKNIKKKVFIGILIAIQSLSMIILSTRIATYGAALIPAVILIVYIFLILLKYEKLNKLFIGFCLALTIINSVIIPFGPAYQNQLIDAQDYGFIKADDSKRAQGKEIVRLGEEGLEPFSKEWIDFYVYMFEDYSYLINVTPPVYYREYYDYRHDPKFWVDLIFDYELEERVSGRQIQNIFTHYKWDPLETNNKLFGLGYGTFMRGSILLEKDFVQQYFSYGPIGFVLICLPWVIVLIYCGIKLLIGYKTREWTFINIVLFMSACIGLASAYLSGHTIDELTTSLFIALCLGVLISNLNRKDVNE